MDVIEGINKYGIKSLLSLATQESYFMFNDIRYKQKDGVELLWQTLSYSFMK